MQNNIFVHSKKYSYIGKPLNKEYQEMYGFIRELVYGDLQSFQAESKVHLSAYLASFPENKPILFSEEELATGAMRSQCPPEDLVIKLKELLPDSKILFAYKGASEIIESLYAYLVKFDLIPFQTFTDFVKMSYHQLLERFDSEKILTRFSKHFDRKNISILDLRENVDIAPKICSYLAEDIDYSTQKLNVRLTFEEYEQKLKHLGIKTSDYKQMDGKLVFVWDQQMKEKFLILENNMDKIINEYSRI